MYRSHKNLSTGAHTSHVYTEESTCGSAKTVSPHQAPDSPRSAGSIMSPSPIPVCWLMVRGGHWHHHSEISGDTAVPTVAELSLQVPDCSSANLCTHTGQGMESYLGRPMLGLPMPGSEGLWWENVWSQCHWTKLPLSSWLMVCGWLPKPPRSSHPEACSLISSRL